MVTDHNKYVHFALQPFYFTPSKRAFPNSNLEHWACFFFWDCDWSHQSFSTVTFFSSTVDYILIINTERVGRLFLPWLQLFPCAVTTHCPHSSNTFILLYFLVGVRVNNRGKRVENINHNTLYLFLLLLLSYFCITLVSGCPLFIALLYYDQPGIPPNKCHAVWMINEQSDTTCCSYY